MTTISIKCLKSDKIKADVHHGQFVIDSLGPGQGITVGNQLRRVLLSDLGGVAISAIRIAGVKHEFATIPGVKEDVLELLLNLKGIVFTTEEQDIQFGRLKVQGPSVITADSIKLPPNFKIVNPDHYIATLSTSNILEIEFKFEYGTGYRLANQIFLDDTENYLHVDAIFMPVQKVDFKIKNIYESGNDISEQLWIDIWTNGSISPTSALESACQIIIDLFTLLINNKNQRPELKMESISSEPYSNIAIEELQLSVRAYNCLKKVQINTVSDLLKYSPKKLYELKNFGRKSADEVFSTLKRKLGISLKE